MPQPVTAPQSLSSLFMDTFCSDGPDNELQWSYNCFAAGSVKKLRSVNFPASAHRKVT